MVWTHGGDGDSVVTDSAGNVIPDYPVVVYDSATGGSHVQDLTEIVGGAAIAALRTDATGPTAGRIRRLHSATHPILWWSVTDSNNNEVRWASHAHEIPTRANQAYTQANTNATDIAAIQTQIGGSSLYAVRTEVPSIEETLVSMVVSWGQAADPRDMVASDGNRNCPVLVAPYPLTILSVDMVFNADIASNANNYWTLQVCHGPANVIVEKTSHDEAITNGQGWSFDSQVFDPGRRTFDEGDVLYVVCLAATGSPSDLLGPSTITVRYARQG
ncbi:MAG: hypothetical protein ACRDQA_08540 [Nocardioidaceae bacterium]